MTARQLAAMVCWESVIIAVSGALLGTTLGAGLGAALASAITVQQAGVATILPAHQLLVDLALASTAGLVAATVPARRAARLNLLTGLFLGACRARRYQTGAQAIRTRRA